MDIFKDIFEQIHIEITGTGKCGKSELLKTIIYKGIQKGDDSKFVAIDPGHNVLSVYEGCKQCVYCYAWDEIRLVLDYYAREIESRYERMIIDGKKHSEAPDVYILIDNYDHVVIRNEGSARQSITKIARKGRAVNIHLIIAVENVKRVSPDVAINMTCKIDLIPTPKGVDYKWNGTKGKDNIPYTNNLDIKKILEPQSDDLISTIKVEQLRKEYMPLEYGHSVYDIEDDYSNIGSSFIEDKAEAPSLTENNSLEMKEQPPLEMDNESKSNENLLEIKDAFIKAREKTWFVVIMLIIFFPLGLYLMWRYTKWNKTLKIVVTIIIILVQIILWSCN